MGNGWQLVGISDESTECEVCGRVELKSTMHLVHEDGSELRAGSSCGARKLGTTAYRMRRAAKAYDTWMVVRRQEWESVIRNFLGCAATPAALAAKHERFAVNNRAERFLAAHWRNYLADNPIKVSI